MNDPYVELAFTVVPRADKQTLERLYNALKDDSRILPSPYNDGRMVRKFEAVKRRVDI